MPFPSLPRRPARRSLGRPTRTDAVAFARRLAHFWLVWSALLLIHEWGHVRGARAQGLAVERVTVGVGPVVWRGEAGGTPLVLRAVPLAGMTSLADAAVEPDAAAADRWSAWRREAGTLVGGVAATLAVATLVAVTVAARERLAGRRWVWGRVVVADAAVLTVFNFLPVPPLDGGRAVLETLAAVRGAPLAGDALLWVQVGGLALAIVPMALWTSWTRRIDSAALWWGAPRPAVATDAVPPSPGDAEARAA